MNKKIPLHIALGFNQGYLIPFYALAASLFANNKQSEITLHIIASGLSEQDKAEIVEYAADNKALVHFYEVDASFASNFPKHFWYGHSIFYRFLFPGLLPESVDRFLYIDTDIIVTANLQYLFNKDLEGCPVAAVADPVVRVRPEIGLNVEGEYFNSGVLLIDRAKWVNLQITAKAIEFFVINHEKATYPDQDALNAILAGKWHKLEPKFNLMPNYIPRTLKRKQTSKFSEDKIIHFAQYFKPWHYLCNNRLRFVFDKYLAMTPKANVDFGNYKRDWNGIKMLFKLHARELYYDYPIIPLSLIDKLKKK